MTCGFFIFSVPCLSKLIIESGLPSRVKHSLGFSSGSNNASHEESGHGSQFDSPSNKPWEHDTTWSKLEEGHIALRVTRSESQTRLHDGVQSTDPNATAQVTHTPNVAVTDNAH
jgi:hypothetical protein